MTARKTLQWLAILVVLGTLAGGTYVYWLWQRSDELLKAAIVGKIAEIAPEWRIEIDRAHFDWSRRVHLHDVRIGGRQTPPLVAFPELIVTVDREKLSRERQVVVHKVRLVNPTVELVRDAAGRWNWQNLPPLPESRFPAPEWEIEQGTVHFRFEQPGGEPPVTLSLQHADLRLIPSGQHQYVVKGLTQVGRTGLLNLDGTLNIAARTWSVSGTMNDVTTSGELTELAASTSPELRQRLARVAQILQQVSGVPAGAKPGTPQSPFARAVAGELDLPAVATSRFDRPAETPPFSIRDLGVSGTFDVKFHIAHETPGAEPQFQIGARIRQGQIANAALPFPLHDISGEIDWSNDGVEIRNLTARNGVTRLGCRGSVTRQGESTPCTLAVNATNLIIDQRLRSRLPEFGRKLYDSLNATGQLDVHLKLTYDGWRKWSYHDLVVTAKNATVTHEKFPYTVTGVSGSVRQQNDDLVIAFQGMAGRRPVGFEGRIRDPGPQAEAVYVVDVRQAPLAEDLVAACPAEVQKTLQSLKLRGTVDARFRLYRPPGPDQDYQQEFTGRLSGGSLEYELFPYRISELSGDVRFSSVDDVYHVTNLRGTHGTAALTGSGTFTKAADPPELTLTIEAAGAQLDKQLQLALPEPLQQIWDDLSPTGTFDLTTEISWNPGRPIRLTMSKIEVYDGTLLAKAFAYPISDIRASFAYTDGYLEIKQLTGRHEETSVAVGGFLEFVPGDNWRLRFVDWRADDLEPDRLFRRALPKELHAALDELNPIGPVSLSGSLLEFRGTSRPEDPVTAAWDVKAVLSGNTLSTGLDLHEVHGEVTARGIWDGSRIDMAGSIHLDSALILDHQFTEIRGPFHLNDTQLFVGARQALAVSPTDDTASIPLEERLTARAIDGLITLDSAVVFEDEPVYHTRITLKQGKLEKYAERYLPGTTNVRGVMTGWLDLKGRGKSPQDVAGRGQLKISPAALYELPLVVQIFRELPFASQDNTAFRDAFLDFDIARGLIHFRRIDLRGNAINLLGRGTARFAPYDGRLQLDFYSTMPPNVLSNIPLVNVVMGEATKGWFGVEVRGTVSQPVARYVAAPVIDDTLRRFLGAFEPPQSALPRVNTPRLVNPFQPTPRSGN